MDDSSSVFEKILKAFPFLQKADNEVRERLLKHALIARIPRGEFIFFEGDECRQLALILSGSVRVYKAGESGKEITLYRLGAGESCILTASCIFAQSSFPAVAVTEEDAEAAVIPAYVFRDWINRYEIWRTYVFNLLSKRFSEVLETLEEVAFRRMDMRIAELLINEYDKNKEGIRTTHQDIASELGTSREVVSRILKHFESENLISLKRGLIHVGDIGRLTQKAEQYRDY